MSQERSALFLIVTDIVSESYRETEHKFLTFAEPDSIMSRLMAQGSKLIFIDVVVSWDSQLLNSKLYTWISFSSHS